MSKVLLFSFIGLMLVLACTPAWGQGTAQISGTVIDNTGAAIAGATVTATQTDTGTARATTTNETGAYVLPDLPIGPYKLDVSANGFRAFSQTGIVLEVRDSITLNPQLQVGALAQAVEVQETAPLVETQDQSVVGEVVESKRLLDLPLNGRNINDLMFLSGGTTIGVNTNPGTRDVFNNSLTPVAIAGGMATDISYTLDGAIDNNPSDNLPLIEPFPDALQEFKIETSALTAGSGGMHGAGLVSLATKSGTNQLHGDLFEFVRNYIFNARDAFATGPDTLKRNQFGGVVGGPIKKDKLFFFAAYQGTTIAQNDVDNVGVSVTSAMLAGDFTAFASPACNGGRQITLKAPFVNNMISPSLFSPAGLALAEKLPLSSNPCGDITYALPVDSIEHQVTGKVDYQKSAKQSIFVRYVIDHYNDPTPYQLSGENNLFTAGTVGGFGQNQSITGSDTYILRPNMINVARLTFNRTDLIKTANNTFSECSLGINVYCGYSWSGIDEGLSGQSDVEKIAVTGGVPANVSAGPELYSQYGVSDDWSWTHGSHQTTLGGLLSYWRSGWPGCTYCSENMTVSGQSTGTGYSDLLLGDVATVTAASPDSKKYYEWYFGLYAADAWKVKPRLTVNLGLRWEPYFAPTPWDGRSYSLSVPNILAGVQTTQYTNALPGLLFPGDPGYPTSGASEMKAQWANVSPRVGLAWDVKGNGRTSVRASFGTFYDVPQGNFPINVNSIPPFEPTINLSGVKLDNPWANYPGGDPFPVSMGKNAPLSLLDAYSILPPNTKTPESFEWNLSLQKQLATNWLVSLSYLGTHSIHLWMSDAANPAVYVPGTCSTAASVAQYGCVLNGPISTTSNTNQRRLLAQEDPAAAGYGFLEELDSGGQGFYNGLIVSGQHRISQGATVTANYTYSHCISDNIASTIGTAGTDYTMPNDPKYDRGNCTESAVDIRHVFTLSAVLQTPNFSNRTLRMVGTGWSFAPLLKINSGQAMTPYTTTDVALTGITKQRVSEVLASDPYSNSNSLQYLNSAAFALPATGGYSNMASGAIFGPGFWELDAALYRDFNLGKTEGRRLEARAEAFNLTNSFRAENPVLIFNSGQFGQITSDYGPRIMQFALKFYY